MREDETATDELLGRMSSMTVNGEILSKLDNAIVIDGFRNEKPQSNTREQKAGNKAKDVFTLCFS